jgi:hypothetical protein
LQGVIANERSISATTSRWDSTPVSVPVVWAARLDDAGWTQDELGSGTAS